MLGHFAVVRAADLLHDFARHVAAAQDARRTLGGADIKAPGSEGYARPKRI